MVLASIRQAKVYPPLQIVPATDTRLNAQCVIRLSSNPFSKTYIATVKSFKLKTTWHNGQPVREEWCNVEIPGVGKRCVPPAFFVCWNW